MPQEKRLFSSDSEGEQDYKPSKKKTIEESSEDDSDNSISDQEEKNSKQPSTKKSKANVERNAEGDQIFPLSTKRRVTVRSFPKGGAAIDIREVYMDKNGEQRPGKGICLPLDQWKKLTAFLPDIEDAIASLPNKK